MPSFYPFIKPAIKVAAAGLGGVIVGPLGAALGGVLGDALGGESAKLIKEYADKFGDKAAEKIFEESEDGLLERLKDEGPALEAVYRTALAAGLKAIAPKAGQECSDWFRHWECSLGSEDVLDLAGVGAGEFTPKSIDGMLERVLVRLDAQGAAMEDGGLSLQIAERAMPPHLLDVVRERLPERFQEAFKALIVSEKYEAAWRELQIASQKRMAALLGSVKEDTTALRAGQSVMQEKADVIDTKVDEILRLVAVKAVDEGRLTETEARAATAEAAAEEWKKKYLELVRQNPSLDNLLRAGDLEAAAERKRGQIERQKEEQAKSYFELGQIEELRFDYAKAADAFGAAWRLKDDPEYGFRYAYAAQRQNRFAEAIETSERLRGRLAKPADLSAMLNNLAMMYQSTQRFGDAESAYKEALEVYRGLALKAPDDYLPDVATALDNLGGFYRNTQQFEESEKHHGEALKIRRELEARSPGAYQPQIAASLNNMAIVYNDVQRLTDAERAYSESLAIYRELAVKNPEEHLSNVATMLNNQALFYSGTGRPTDAEKTYEEALKIRRELAAKNPEAYLPDVAVALNNLGTLYRAEQRFEESGKAHSEALQIRRELAVKNPDAYLPDIAVSLNNLGNFQISVQQYDEAEKSYKDALESYRGLAARSPDAYLPSVATTLNNLANLYGGTQRLEESVRESEEAEQILAPFWQRSREVHGDLMARILGLRAEVLVLMGRSQSEACELARRALNAAYLPALKGWLEKSVEAKCGAAE